MRRLYRAAAFSDERLQLQGHQQPTRRWLTNLPAFSAVPGVDTGSQAYRAAAQEARLLSRNDACHKLYQYSRTSFNSDHRTEVHALLTEVMQSRIMQMPSKTLQEYIHLAHVAGLHELCVGLYHARFRQEAARGGGEKADPSSAAASSSSTPSTFIISEYVVDSAYAMRDVNELVRLASICHQRVADCVAKGQPLEMLQFSMLRVLWRTVCLAEHWAEEESRGTFPENGSHEQALAAATSMAKAYVAPRLGLAEGEEGGLKPAEPENQPGISSSSHKYADVGSFLRMVRRLIRYDSSGDEGEMLFFRKCLELGVLRAPQDKGDSAPISTAAAQLVNSPTTLPDIELFYATLIGTCGSGKHAEQAMQYFSAARGLPWTLDGYGEAPPPCASLAVSHGRNDTNKKAATTTAPKAKAVTEVSEYLLYRLLSILQLARASTHTVQLARVLLQEGAGISISVWSALLLAAGETRSVDVATAAYHGAVHRLQELQQEDGRAASMMAHERRGWEYLVQTSLHALANCQVRHYEEAWLRPAYDNGWIHCSMDYYYCCLLQDAHNATDPLGAAERILDAMKESDVPLSAGIVTRLLRIYLRLESPEFLSVYREAVEEKGLFRSAWLDELVRWAGKRRYFLTHAEREYIISETQRHKLSHGADNTNTTSQHVNDASKQGALRRAYRLLCYDHDVQPIAYFKEKGCPPPTAPKAGDMQVFFATSRPLQMLRGLQRGRVLPSAAGDPMQQQDVAGVAEMSCSALLTTGGGGGTTAAAEAGGAQELREKAARVYLAGMLEGMQRAQNYVA